MTHQRTHKPPMHLGARHPMRAGRRAQNMRHAAPILYHVGKASDGTLSVRIVVFPQLHLPDLDTSRLVLQQAMGSVSKAMTEAANVYLAG